MLKILVIGIKNTIRNKVFIKYVLVIMFYEMIIAINDNYWMCTKNYLKHKQV